jgi:outer membrane protein assembly factor BamB
MVTKFGWMEIMDASLWLEHKPLIQTTTSAIPSIVPLVLIPLTGVTVLITSAAAIIAGWFGIKLKTEGPKQFLEVLLRKRVLVTMLIVNFVGIATYKTMYYVKTLPAFLSTVVKESDKNAIISTENYPDQLLRIHSYRALKLSANINSLILEKEIKLSAGAFRSGVISGNSIFYGSDDGNIYEIDKHNLEIKRKFFIGTEVTTRPIIYNKRIYSGEGVHNTHHARIYSFSLESGKFLNAFETKGHTEGQPVLGNDQGKDILFITAGADGIYAIDPLKMTEIWHQNDGHLDATVSIEGSIVYTGTGIEKGSLSDRRYAVAYDFHTGEKKWKKELPMSNWMHPVITEHYVCFTLGEIYFPSLTGLLHCLDKKDGSPKFSIPFDGPIASKALYIKENIDEYIFFGDMKGEVCGVNINSREKKWCYKTGRSDTKSSFTSFDYDQSRGIIWYPSSDNGLFAIDPKLGKPLLQWTPENSQWGANYASVTIDGDYIYHMDISGKLRKFKTN